MRLAGGSPQTNEAPHFYETLVILLHCMYVQLEHRQWQWSSAPLFHDFGAC